MPVTAVLSQRDVPPLASSQNQWSPGPAAACTWVVSIAVV